MDSHEILRALQAGEISFEVAKKALQTLATTPDRPSVPKPLSASQREGVLAQSSDHSQSEKTHEPSQINKQSDQQRQARKIKTDSESSRPKEAIAIVGMSGRYPDADNLDCYWDNLVQAKNSVREIPNSRWNVDKYFDPRISQKGKVYCKWMGLLDDVEYFDPLFFMIPPAEAQLIDPQQRIFLQEGYKAFEDAGYNHHSLSNKKCGVYLGIMGDEYARMLHQGQSGTSSATGSSFAIAAARIAYFLNLKGPAIAIDTACSSSLVATDMACKALLNQDIDMALVGGVSLYLTPESYISMCMAGMLSPEGKCKTFDNSADGFVPGEGVGALVLKRLEDAELDNDSIYGVIIASGTNQDGKTNGITAPSVNSQMELCRDIYDRYKIKPESISYAEMHGTGTKLGDPIELEALGTVFSEKSNRKNYCAIGSVKSNIGHTSAAAGVASVQKVLLCLKNKKLVPTLNCLQPNEHFNFSESPFYINDSVHTWDTETSKPRRACVSSFGYSGTNAHIVIEEYCPKPEIIQTHNLANRSNPLLFVLSAKSKKQLIIYAKEIASWVESNTNISLADMAYTLQVGREAMDFRLAFTVDSRAEMLQILEDIINGRLSSDVLTAQVKKSKNEVTVFEADEDAQVLLQAWMRNRKFKKLAELWVKGLSIDWNELYGESRPHRISLPTYPFARERYWIPQSSQASVGIAQRNDSSASCIHPLLHKNTSDLSEQRYSSSFTGEEFFLADHVVKGQRILPAVAHIEMARAAIEQATGVLMHSQNGFRLTDLVWQHPLIVDEPLVNVDIGLLPEDNGNIIYRVYNKPDGDGAESVIYSQGIAVMVSVSDAISTLDIHALQAQCHLGTLTSSKCYEIFRAMGLEYGSAHQGLEKVYIGTGQVLARLCLPSNISETSDQFVLHPSIMDSALQASIALIMDVEKPNALKPALPFALRELEVFGKCTSTMWSFVRYSEGSTAKDKVWKLDIDICDAQGNVCVRMKGFSMKALENGETKTVDVTQISDIPTEPSVGIFSMTPTWDTATLEKVRRFPAPDDGVVIVGGTAANRRIIQQHYPEARHLETEPTDSIDIIAEKLQDYATIDHIIWIAPHKALGSLGDEALIEEQNQGVLYCFRMIKALLGSGYGNRDLGWSVITTEAQPIHKNDVVNPTHASLHGLIGTMAKEYKNWKIRGIDLDAGCEWPLSDLFTLPPDVEGNIWVYRGGDWYRQRLIPVQTSSLEQTMYRRGGVYVVIGGAGGIGEVWSEYMIRSYQAQIIWIGRRQKDAAIQSKLDRLAAPGPVPLYITADAGDRQALSQAYAEIKQQHPQIHGLIHSAIVLADQSLAAMDEKRFRIAFSAKVDVSVRLAQVFRQERLDFVLFFSSVNAFTKTAGQSNYVAGCTFKDVFAHQLNREWPTAIKVMNWGYWGSVGIVASKDHQNRMAKAGVGSIEPPEAMAALETLIAGSINQMALIKTTRPKVMEGIHLEELITTYAPIIPSVIEPMQQQPDLSRRDHALLTEIEKSLIQIASESLNVKANDIDSDTELTEYGLDPVLFVEFSRKLNQKYNLELNSQLFITYPTLRKFAEYLQNEYEEIFAKHFQKTLSVTDSLKTPTSVNVNNPTPQHDPQAQEVDEFFGQLLWGQLQSMGLFIQKTTTLNELKIQIGLCDLYDRWFEASIAFLVERNYLEFDGISCFVLETPKIDGEVLWQQWEQKKGQWLNNPNLKSQIVLAETMLQILPEILTGKKRATDYMFPNSSMELVEGVYKNNEFADHFNWILADTLVSYIRARLQQDTSAHIRILEIGAGTGGVSAGLFEKLKPYRDNIKEYCYTDLSKAFLLHAEKEYGPSNPYLTYKIFNVSSATAEQGIDLDAYDLVIAANVLHATPDIRQTLRNAKAVLKNNGLLVLNEISKNSLFTHLTFGLLEGWWLHEDTSLRIPGSPALSPDSWQAVLESEGFRSVLFPALKSHDLGQQIVIAESDGVVRQKQSSKLKTTVMNNVMTMPESPRFKDKGHASWASGAIKKDSEITEQTVEYYVKDTIKEILSDSLKVDIDLIYTDESFADYGVDSITGVHIVQVINQTLEIELETTSLFDYSSVDQLTTYVLSQHKEEISQSLGEKSEKIDKNSIESRSNKDGTIIEQTVEYYVKDTIKEVLSDSLKVDIDLIYTDESFADYGVDSITGVHIVQVINQTLEIELETTSLFDYSSVDQLTVYILSQHKDEISQSFGKKSARAYEISIESPNNDKRKIIKNTHSKRFIKKKTISNSGNIKKQAKSTDSSNRNVPIAIIGMGGRFAKSQTVDELWEHISKGTDLIEQVTRWDFSKYYSVGTKYCNHGGLLEEIDQFDPSFFNISALEATYMDPQQRFFLQESWTALEDAGYAGTAAQGLRCGVYVGGGAGDYQKLFEDNPPAQAFWGNAGSVIPARIAYHLDLQGPAIAIDTACSSSLVAIHLACQGLWNGETEMALAGGVFIQSTPWFYLSSNRAEMLSPTGRCYTFDERADGFVPGEGSGAVVLKRLEDAIADGDNIYGVIKASGINQDGTTNGITAPSAKSQERLLRYIYDTFDIDPESIQMVEAHGTGTKLGDPIEFQGLTRAFKQYTDKKGYCALGSIKTNLGHAATAAGIAGLIKILLSLKHKQIPPSLHYQLGNSSIQFEKSPFYVNSSLRSWDTEPNSKRRAALSSFGFSGTNAHMVIDESPDIDRSHAEKPAYLIVLSARTFKQLQQQVEQLLAHCTHESDVDCGNVSFTLLLGRKHFNHRLACVVRDQIELIDFFKTWLEKGKAAQVYIAELSERDHRERASLKRHGNQCIKDCQTSNDVNDFSEYLSTIAELYLQGYKLDFKQLFSNDNYSKISLPTYPFSRESYWVGSADDDPRKAPEPKSPVDEKTDLVFKQLIWQKKSGDISVDEVNTEGASLIKGDVFILLCEAGLRKQINLESFRNIISEDAEVIELAHAGPGITGLAEEYQNICLNLFGRIKSHLKKHPRENIQLLFVYDSSERAKIYQKGLIALLKSLQKEKRKLNLKVICITPKLLTQNYDFNTIIRRELQKNPTENAHVQYRISDEDRWVESIEKITPAQNLATISFSDKDLFWITGGMGSLALLVANDLIKRGVRNILLTGRSKLTPKNRKIVESMKKSTFDSKITIEYHKVDVSQSKEVEQFVKTIRASKRNLTGIIHSAGIVDDALIGDKTKTQVARVLAPKVQGIENIDNATKDEQLDYFILFSSLVSITGNIGQCDYASANGFLDGFAQYRQQQVDAGDRHGKTISINWPYWKEGGMSLDERLQKVMTEQTGIVPLTTSKGLSAFNNILGQDWTQVIVTEVKRALFEKAPINNLSASGISEKHETVAEGAIAEAMLDFFSEITRIPSDQIHLEQELHELGLDSIMTMQLFNKVEQKFGVRIFVSEMQVLKSVQEFIDYVKQEINLTTTELIDKETLPVDLSAQNFPVKNDSENGDSGYVRSLQSKVVLDHKKTRKTIFVLGTPRAGSTLLRVMLGGNQKIFSPPELYLLGYKTMKERGDVLNKQNKAFVKEGLVEAINALSLADKDVAHELIEKFEKDEVPIASVYQYIHAHLDDRYLVDKTPLYGKNMDCLQQAENELDQPLYIYLYRHPLAVMGSLVKNRFHKIMQVEGDPWKIAETTWSQWNNNITDFLENISAERQIHIPYESLVTNPESWMKFLCERFGIKYVSNMTHPYQDSKQRMIRGLNTDSLMIGDPNFLTHSNIDAKLALAWRDHRERWSSLQPTTARIAKNLGYSVDDKHSAPYLEKPGKTRCLLPAQEGFLHRNRENQSWHIITEITLEAEPLKIQRNIMQKNYQRLLQNYPALRTTWKYRNSVWTQHVDKYDANNKKHQILWFDARKVTQEKMKMQQRQLLSEMKNELNICTGRIISVAIMQLPENEYYCLIVLHHMAGDGFSMQAILNSLFNVSRLSSVLITQKNYMDIISMYNIPSYIKKLKSYWKRAENSETTFLPGKKEWPSNNYCDELEYRNIIPINNVISTNAPNLEKIAWNDVAAALYAQFTEKNTAEKITIAHRFHRRYLSGHSEMVDDVGYYAGDIPMTLNSKICNNAKIAGEHLSHIRSEITLGGVEYEILSNLGEVRPAYELTKVRLNYQPLPPFFSDDAIHVKKINTFLYEPGNKARLYDLDCIVRQDLENIVFIVRYNKNNYLDKAIKSFVNDWIQTLTENLSNESVVEF